MLTNASTGALGMAFIARVRSWGFLPPGDTARLSFSFPDDAPYPLPSLAGTNSDTSSFIIILDFITVGAF